MPEPVAQMSEVPAMEGPSVTDVLGQCCLTCFDRDLTLGAPAQPFVFHSLPSNHAPIEL